MKKFCGLLVIMFITSVLGTVTVYGALTGNMRGIIKDVEGNPIKGVMVTISSPQLQGTRITYTYGDGEYFFFDLAPGTYSLKAELKGLQIKKFTGIVLKVNQTIKFDFEMELEKQRETVEVTAEAPVLDATSATIATVVEREFTERLPGSDGYQSALSFSPGSVKGGDGNPNVHGSSKMDNTYLIDGIDTTDPLTNTFGTNFNPDAVQEIEVQTGGFKAEYGRSMGGIVNVITKSGGNEFSGIFRFNIIDNSWVSAFKNIDDAGYRGQDSQDYNLLLGGPIVKDKLWFFISYGIAPNTTEKNLMLNEYDENGEIKTTKISADRDFVDYFGKLTYQLNRNNKIVAQVFGDPATIHADEDVNYSPEAQSVQKQGGTSFNLSWTYVYRPELFLETKVNGSLSMLDVTPESGDLSGVSYHNETKDVWYGNNNTWSETDRNRYGASFATNYFKQDLKGDHKFKFGTEYQHLELKEYFTYTGNGMYYSTREDDDGVEQPYRRFNILNAERTEATGDIYALFLQDDWEVIPGLTLNLGVRMDYAVYENDVGKESGKFDNMVAPRIGTTYDVTNDGRSKIYGHFGRYYNTQDLQIPSMLNEKVPTFETYKYNPETGEYELESVSGAPEYPNEIDPNLKPEYSDEVVIGYDHEIATNTVAGIRGVYKRTRDIVEDIGLYWDDKGNRIDSPYSEDFANISYLVTNPKDAKRDYYALELDLQRKTENLNIVASYSYSQAKGSVVGQHPQAFGSVSHFSSDFDTPETSRNLYGRLPWDAPHYFKLYASYRLPWGGVYISPYFIARSGYAYTKFGEDPLYGKGYTYPEGRGTYRYPSIAVMDLSVQKDIKTWKYGVVTFIAEILNVFNSQEVVKVGQNEGNYFGVTRSRISPRTFRFGLKFEF